MPLNFQQLYERIHQIGQAAPDRQAALADLRARAHALLHEWAGMPSKLHEILERARQIDPSLRCAVPLQESIHASFPPPALDHPVTLLAADGSQILPDRHASVLYSLVNVGAIALQPGSGAVPGTFTDTSLRYAEELYTESGRLTDEAIQQQRDIAERRMLLDLAPRFPAPLLALTDGPVELWGAKGAGEQEYRQSLEIHKSVLSQLQARDVTVAGYVDKPGADLVVRSLEITLLTTPEEFRDLRRQHPLRGVTDRWLYAFLPAGHRSAVFELQSSSRTHYTGDLALHFFYLNVGDAGHPWLARVEIPAWVAADPARLDTLHAALLDQCRIMGVRPYPYILQRAHEIAVVHLDEKKQVEQMLAMELRKAGVEPDSISYKQSAKNPSG